jgi:adenylylsulfate kinase
MGASIMTDSTNNETLAADLTSEHSAAMMEGPQAEAILSSSVQDSAGLTVWFTGLSGAGKTTLCNTVFKELLALGFKVEVLDGDTIRKSLNRDLGFSREDRDENIRRIGFVAELLARHGVIVLVAAISPYRHVREELRNSLPNFIEVYVNAPLAVCEQRDPKGLYRRARNREITNFTGIDDPYEPPLAPDVECATDRETVEASTNKVVSTVLGFSAVRNGKQRINIW